jgi:hypothetical protein
VRNEGPVRGEEVCTLGEGEGGQSVPWWAQTDRQMEVSLIGVACANVVSGCEVP